MTSWISLLDVIYPVGSVYFSANSTSPSTLIGGSWVAIEAGATLLAAGENYSATSYSGSKSISEEQLPPHSHVLYHNSAGQLCYVIAFTDRHDTDAGNNVSGSGYKYPCIASSESIVDFSETEKGGGDGQEYVPYGVNIYMWRRVS